MPSGVRRSNHSVVPSERWTTTFSPLGRVRDKGGHVLTKELSENLTVYATEDEPVVRSTTSYTVSSRLAPVVATSAEVAVASTSVGYRPGSQAATS